MTRNSLFVSSKCVVIDVPAIGWANDRKDQLLKRYKDIRVMGTLEELPQDKKDTEIAEYCKSNSCDLLTKDNRAYIFSFKVGVKKVLIERYGVDEGHKNAPVYILRFIE